MNHLEGSFIDTLAAAEDASRSPLGNLSANARLASPAKAARDESADERATPTNPFRPRRALARTPVGDDDPEAAAGAPAWHVSDAAQLEARGWWVRRW